MKADMNGLLPLPDALALALSSISPVTQTQRVPCADALHRIVSEDVISSVNLPPVDNSAMDGYAVKYEEASTNAVLRMCGTLAAGMSPQDCQLVPGGAIRIMTGAPIPAGADAVVMQENTSLRGQELSIVKSPHKGENIRPQGQDIRKGDRILSAGSRITAAHAMLLAATGQVDVAVFRKPKIGIIATGDELTYAEEHLRSGAIFESNRAGVAALLDPMKIELNDYGIVRDDPAAIKNAFAHAAGEVDILISSGGVSVGDADYVKRIVAELGTVNFWKIAIKPGKPFAFGKLGNAIFCGLPGNPVSAYVTTEQIVVPLIRKLQGEQSQAHTRLALQARLNSPIKRRPGRQDFQRAHLWRGPDGQYQVEAIANQSSGVISSLSRGNCYIVIPADVAFIKAGSQVKVEPFALHGNWDSPC